MGTFIDDMVVSHTCQCGHEIRKTLRWFKKNPESLCPECGEEIKVSPYEFLPIERELRKALSE